MDALPDPLLARILALAVRPWTANGYRRVCRRWNALFEAFSTELMGTFAIERHEWSAGLRSTAAAFLSARSAPRAALQRLSLLGGGRELSEIAVGAGGWDELRALEVDAAAPADEDEADAAFGETLWGGAVLADLTPRLERLKAVGATAFREMTTLYSRFDATCDPPPALHTVELVDLLVPLAALDALLERCAALRCLRLTQLTVRVEAPEGGDGLPPRVRWQLLASRHRHSLEELSVVDSEYVSAAEDDSEGLLADAACLAAATACPALGILRLVALEPPEDAAYPPLLPGAWPRLDCLELRPSDGIGPAERLALRAFLASLPAAGARLRTLGTDCVTAAAVAPHLPTVERLRLLGWGRDAQFAESAGAVLAALERAYPCLEEADLTRCEGAFADGGGYDVEELRAFAARGGARVRTVVLRPPSILPVAPPVFRVRAMLEAALDAGDSDRGLLGRLARHVAPRPAPPGLRVLACPVRDFRHLHAA